MLERYIETGSNESESRTAVEAKDAEWRGLCVLREQFRRDADEEYNAWQPSVVELRAEFATRVMTTKSWTDEDLHFAEVEADPTNEVDMLKQVVWQWRRADAFCPMALKLRRAAAGHRLKDLLNLAILHGFDHAWYAEQCLGAIQSLDEHDIAPGRRTGHGVAKIVSMLMEKHPDDVRVLTVACFVLQWLMNPEGGLDPAGIDEVVRFGGLAATTAALLGFKPSTGSADAEPPEPIGDEQQHLLSRAVAVVRHVVVPNSAGHQQEWAIKQAVAVGAIDAVVVAIRRSPPAHAAQPHKCDVAHLLGCAALCGMLDNDERRMEGISRGGVAAAVESIRAARESEYSEDICSTPAACCGISARARRGAWLFSLRTTVRVASLRRSRRTPCRTVWRRRGAVRCATWRYTQTSTRRLSTRALWTSSSRRFATIKPTAPSARTRAERAVGC